MHLEVENSTWLGESQPYHEMWAGQGSANPMFNAYVHTVTLGTPKKVPGDAAKRKEEVALHVASLPSMKLPPVGCCECRKAGIRSRKERNSRERNSGGFLNI